MKSPTESHSLEITRDIAASPVTVFGFLTDPRRFARWIQAPVSLEPSPGGALAIDFAHHATKVVGQVLELVADRRIVFSWGVAEGAQKERMPAGSTTVAIDLEPVAAGSRLTLRHSGLPDEKERDGHRGGWTHYVGELARLAFEAGLATGLEERLDAFCTAWSETDAGRRRSLLESAVTTEFEYVDIHARLHGRTAFDAHVAGVQQLFPGGKVRRTTTPQLCYEFAQYAWVAVDPGGQTLGAGRNHVTLAPDGKVVRIVAFWGNPAAETRT